MQKSDKWRFKIVQVDPQGNCRTIKLKIRENPERDIPEFDLRYPKKSGNISLDQLMELSSKGYRFVINSMKFLQESVFPGEDLSGISLSVSED